jgi:hypothetical protein
LDLQFSFWIKKEGNTILSYEAEDGNQYLNISRISSNFGGKNSL